MLVCGWVGLYWVLHVLHVVSSYFDHYIKIGEVIGFGLFRATGLPFAIRPKDGVARQGRRGVIFKVHSILCQIYPLHRHARLPCLVMPEGETKKKRDEGFMFNTF